MSLYLGLDSSTQGLKSLIIDADSGEIVASEAVNFTADLPQFGCENGVLSNPDPLVQHSDPGLWAAAMDLLFERLQQANAPLSEIAGISGSGQQHGSVYFKPGFADALADLDPSVPLYKQVMPLLSRRTSPIWMDSSTSEECEELNAAIGRDELQRRTGSPAIERFTGPQIRRFAKTQPEDYRATARIHLVSSFMASLLIGGDAPIDYGDGAGMNLLNLENLDWDQEIAHATAPELLDKLQKPVASNSVVGKLHPYFSRYGLRPGVPVLAWSGDNPNSLVGTGAIMPGVGVISLGTSDTFFAALSEPKVDPDGYGHVFGNPAGGFMCLICFKNGSLARERIKEQCGVDWQSFDVTAFSETAPGNNGNLMLPWFEPETTPLTLTPGSYCRGDGDFVAGKAAPSVRIRAVVESQALAMRLHTAWTGSFDCLRITGGGSRSPGVCQVIADVFQSRVEKISVPDSAALGAAMRAANGIGNCDWNALLGKFSLATEKIEPRSENAAIYEDALNRYAEFEREKLAGN